MYLEICLGLFLGLLLYLVEIINQQPISVGQAMTLHSTISGILKSLTGQ